MENESIIFNQITTSCNFVTRPLLSELKNKAPGDKATGTNINCVVWFTMMSCPIPLQYTMNNKQLLLSDGYGLILPPDLYL